MKRGYMDWKKNLLPEAALKARQEAFISGFESAGIDAAVVYADVASADELQYLANFGPYWVNAAGIFLASGEVTFVTGLSPRVSPWVSNLTGMPMEKIAAAGPKIDSRVAEVLAEKLGAGASVGATGRYFPEVMAANIEKAGFKLSVYEMGPDMLLEQRDGAYRATLAEGIGLMKGAVKSVLDDPAMREVTARQLAAELEHACRGAGAMDFVLLFGDNKLVFEQAQKLAETARPASLYLQIQYLGEWMVLAMPLWPSAPVAAFAARDSAAKALTPGAHADSWEEGGLRFALCPAIRSDHMGGQEKWSGAWYENQVVSLTVTDTDAGVYLEHMLRVTPAGGELLFDL